MAWDGIFVHGIIKFKKIIIHAVIIVYSILLFEKLP